MMKEGQAQPGMEEYLDIHPEAAEALAAGKGVVALESTIIAHGMPYPDNLETAMKVAAVIRERGAVPATVGILGGRIKVGMSPEELEFMAATPDILKVSRRDMPYLVARKLNGATTVAATMIAARMAGIRIFVTGGIGGVHRGASETFDISADLEEMKQTDVVVVCAGAKSVLDIGATLEYLETAGVPVVTVGSGEFPAFYSRESGFPSQCVMEDPAEIARLIRTKYALGLHGGMLIACPVPKEKEIPFRQMESVIKLALDECEKQGVSGKKVTPFLLDKVKDLTGGRSLEANIALVLNNAAVGAEISKELAEEEKSGSSPA